MKPKDLRDEFALAALSQCAAAVFEDERRGMTHNSTSGDRLKTPDVIALMAGEIADAMMADRLKVDQPEAEPQAEPWEAAHGYQEAFYKIAEILGIGAIPTTPAQAFASVIVPKLRELMSESARKSQEYPDCSGDPASCPENEGHGCCGRKA